LCFTFTRKTKGEQMAGEAGYSASNTTSNANKSGAASQFGINFAPVSSGTSGGAMGALYAVVGAALVIGLIYWVFKKKG
jgi:uncharacterized membrane protein